MAHNLLSEDDEGSVGDHKGLGRKRKGRKGGKHIRKTSSISGDSAMGDAALPSGDVSEENEEEEQVLSTLHPTPQTLTTRHYTFNTQQDVKDVKPEEQVLSAFNLNVTVRHPKSKP